MAAMVRIAMIEELQKLLVRERRAYLIYTGTIWDDRATPEEKDVAREAAVDAMSQTDRAVMRLGDGR